MYLLNCFFVYSILGYIIEMIFGYAIGSNAESGVLYGPWTPIYGFASILIILISDKCFKNFHLPRWVETILVFFILMVVITGLEFLGGVVIELLFGFSFWDYSDRPFHLGKYVCLEFAFIWGILSIIFIYILRPFMDKVIKRIPKWLTILFFILLLFDFGYRVFMELSE